ncbi:hypothetical protein REPUB_Repub01dG0090500 [Reevesia pubescens]
MQPRAREFEAVVFVENLPEKVSFSNLRNLFSTFGEIKDVFVSKKRNIQRKFFGFIKFFHKSDADDAVEGLNGRFIEGYRILLNIVKYDRNRRPIGVSESGNEGKDALFRMNRPRFSFKEALVNGLEHKKSLKVEKESLNQYPVCEGFINKSCFSWLNNSLVLITKEVLSIDKVKKNLCESKFQFLNVKSFGPRLFLISVIHSEQIVLLESSNWDLFKAWSLRCFKWVPSLSMHIRIASVALRGVPWQAWSVETVANALKNWGEVLSVETDINEVDNLEEMVVLVQVDDLQKIYGKVLCNLDHGSIVVFVEELNVENDVARRSIASEEGPAPVESHSTSINENRHVNADEQSAPGSMAADRVSRVLLDDINTLVDPICQFEGPNKFDEFKCKILRLEK